MNNIIVGKKVIGLGTVTEREKQTNKRKKKAINKRHNITAIIIIRPIIKKADVNWICEGEPVAEGGDDEQ